MNHMHISRNLSVRLMHMKDKEWSCHCQYKDDDDGQWCDFEENGSRDAVETAALHHMLTKRDHPVLIFETIRYHYRLEGK